MVTALPGISLIGIVYSRKYGVTMTRGIAFAIFLFGGMFISEIETSPNLPPQMERFPQSLAGDWSIEFTVNPTEALPKGGIGHGDEVWKPGPGGLSFIEEYRSVGDEGEITGSGVYWWDEHLNRIQVLWCANYLLSGCEIMSEGASWEDDRLILKNRWESAGRTHFVKEVFSDISATSFTQTIFQGESFEKLKPVYVFHAKRKPG
jgi:hypothetical protein